MDEAPSTFFVGRDDELRWLSERLVDRSTRLITVTGIGGLGKTALAVRIAEMMSPAFRDGTQVVNLQTLDDHTLVALQLETRFASNASGGAVPASALIDHFRDQHALIVYDNFEHVSEASWILSEIHDSCPNVWQLATSRSSLGISGEVVFALSPLEVPLFSLAPDPAELLANPAARLFVHHLQQSQRSDDLSTADLAAIIRICAKLDGIPLALELTARRLSRTLTIQEIEKHISLAMVHDAGTSDSGARQSSMQSLLQWSYDRLDPGEQRVFLVLGLCSGGATVESLTSLMDRLISKHFIDPMSADQILGALETLSKIGYIQVERRDDLTRFTMLRLIREFAHTFAANEINANEVIRQEHAENLLAFGRRANRELSGSDPKPWMDRIADEQDNLRQAMSWFYARNLPDFGIELACSIWPFWRQKGLLPEALQWLERGIASSPTLPTIHSARAYLYIGHTIQADAERRKQAYEQAFRQFQALDDVVGQTGALDSLGLIWLDQGKLPEAERALSLALQLTNRSGDRKSRGFILNHLGILKIRSGELGAAHALLTEALGIWRELRAIEHVGFAQLELGRLERQREQFWPSQEYLRNSEAVFRQAGSIVGRGYALQELGQTQLSQHLVHDALLSFREALALFTEAEVWDDDVISCVEGIAWLAVDQRPKSAAQLLFFRDHVRTRQGFTRLAVNDLLLSPARDRLHRKLDHQTDSTVRALAELMTPAEALALAAEPNLIRDRSAILTRTERAVIQLTARGLSDEEIGTALHMSRNTARTHQAAIKQKLGVKSRTQAVREAESLGLLESDQVGPG